MKPASPFFGPFLPKDKPFASAQALLAAAGASTNIVRRYREEPAPLVRDVPKGWRTGRLDEVLAGNFDLFTADAARK